MGVFVRPLAVQLRRLRLESGLDLEEVASGANLSRLIYRQYENGESRRSTPSNPALRSIMAISQVSDVPLQQLLPVTFPDLRNR